MRLDLQVSGPSSQSKTKNERYGNNDNRCADRILKYDVIFYSHSFGSLFNQLFPDIPGATEPGQTE